MPIAAPIDYVQVGGKVDVLVAFPVPTYTAAVYNAIVTPARTGVTVPTTGPDAYQMLWKLGELEDMVDPRFRDVLHGVAGDRYGGASGPPIEQQFLGRVAEIDLSLSRWDGQVFALLNRIGGLFYDTATGAANTTNAIRLTDVGSLLMRDRSFRLLLVSNRDLAFVSNFPCCLLESDFGASISTKYSRLSMRITAHRTPEGHWSDPTGVVGTSTSIGVVVNNNRAGTPTPYVLI